MLNIYMLKNINKYEDGEEYFHVDLFNTEDDARKQMNSEFNEFLESDYGNNKNELDVCEIDETTAELRDGLHVSTWEIDMQSL